MSSPRFVSATSAANIDKILAHLVKCGTATQRELAVATGLSKDYMGSYLRHLLSAGKVHVAAPQNRVRSGSCPILWGAGPVPDDEVVDTCPRRVIVRKQWEPNHCRMKLDCYLFGIPPILQGAA